MLDVDSIDRKIFLEYEEVANRWGINIKTLLGILEEYNLEIHRNGEDKKYCDWNDGHIRVFLIGSDQTPYLRLSVVKEFEQTEDYPFKKIKGQPSIEARPEFLSADEWWSYQEKTRVARNKGAYSDKQAHYWRSRAVFRYLNSEVLNNDRRMNNDHMKAILQKTYQDIIQFGCEQVAYDLPDIKRWLTEKCPVPENYDKKPKPWEDPASDKSQERQMKPPSRHRECVQAVAFIILSQNRKLSDETFVRMCRQDYLRNILDSVREEDLNDSGNDQPKSKKIESWIKGLVTSFHSNSEKNK